MKSVKQSGLMRALLLCLSLFALAAFAEGYPKRPIRLIVPFGPGSGSDVIARTLGKYLQERWQQPVVIDNRPGANGIIGATALKNATADGYTLGISTNSTHAAAPHLVRALEYDPLNEFEHIALIGTGGAVALVPADSPFKTISELASYAQAHPGKVFFGHADTISQIPAELLKARARAPFEGVPYKTSAQVITDLIGGQLQFAFFNYMTGAAQVAGGKLVPIAVSEARRNPHWPNVPTVSETFPGYEVTFFAGVSAPSGLAADIVASINTAINEAQSDPTVKAPLEHTGLTFMRQTPRQYRNFIASEGERWKQHLKAAGVQPQ